MSDGEGREDLAELLARRALTEDAARAEAVERRHASGGRTARENVADLVDPGSFVEYGRYAIAAQRGRREVQPAMIEGGGLGRVEPDAIGRSRRRPATALSTCSPRMRRRRLPRRSACSPEREQRVRDLTTAAEENAKALNAVALFELGDVVDPAETRALVAATFAAATDPTTKEAR